MMKILLFGSKGMLGTDLADSFKNHDLYSFSKDEVDITSKKSVFEKISAIKPSLVINAAAYTDVDGSEVNKNKAMEVNATAVKHLALASKKYDNILLHFSTDYIFDGKDKKGYTEESKEIPVNYYGLTKLKGEQHIKNICKKYYIVRTQWLYGNHGKNFVETIIKLTKEKKEIKVVNDQFGSPTYTKDLAGKIETLVSNYDYGIYHITNSGVCTWFDFTKLIVKLIKSKTKVAPITSDKLQRPAKRPQYSLLLNTKFKDKMRSWQSALKAYLAER